MFISRYNPAFHAKYNLLTKKITIDKKMLINILKEWDEYSNEAKKNTIFAFEYLSKEKEK